MNGRLGDRRLLASRQAAGGILLNSGKPAFRQLVTNPPTQDEIAKALVQFASIVTS